MTKIWVSAKTNSKNPNVKQLDKTHFQVAVKEAPVDGKANQAIAKALAKYLGIGVSRVQLVSGQKSKQKYFQIN